MAAPRVRPYHQNDFVACLAVFDSNLPKFFAPQEREEFVSFLQGMRRGQYIVLEDGSAVIACGGLVLDETGQSASLSWGMVAQPHHGQGLGTHLTQARLDIARRLPGLAKITLSTSQHTTGFYTGFGFVTQQIVPQGFGPDLHRHDMVLHVLR